MFVHSLFPSQGRDRWNRGLEASNLNLPQCSLVPISISTGLNYCNWRVNEHDYFAQQVINVVTFLVISNLCLVTIDEFLMNFDAGIICSTFYV